MESNMEDMDMTLTNPVFTLVDFDFDFFMDLDEPVQQLIEFSDIMPSSMEANSQSQSSQVSAQCEIGQQHQEQAASPSWDESTAFQAVHGYEDQDYLIGSFFHQPELSDHSSQLQQQQQQLQHQQQQQLQHQQQHQLQHQQQQQLQHQQQQQLQHQQQQQLQHQQQQQLQHQQQQQLQHQQHQQQLDTSCVEGTQEGKETVDEPDIMELLLAYLGISSTCVAGDIVQQQQQQRQRINRSGLSDTEVNSHILQQQKQQQQQQRQHRDLKKHQRQERQAHGSNRLQLLPFIKYPNPEEEKQQHHQQQLHDQRQQQQQQKQQPQLFMESKFKIAPPLSQIWQLNDEAEKDDPVKQLLESASLTPRSSTSSAEEILALICDTRQSEALELFSSNGPFDTDDQEKIHCISKIINRCEQTESRKVLVHQFVLAILVAGHCRMFSTGLTGLLTFSTEDGIDTDEMSENFAVRDKEAVGRIWNKVKENKKGKYDTFARAMRLGRERNKGYFVFLSAGKRAKKLIYKLGPKGMDDLRSWVATCKVAFVTDDWSG